MTVRQASVEGAGSRRFLRYPLWPPARPTLAERVALRMQRFGPVRCTVCGRITYVTRFGSSTLEFRDRAFCAACLATNRQRQLATIILSVFRQRTDRRVRSLADLAGLSDFSVYNAEAQGPVHRQLARLPGYTCSEYFGPGHRGGQLVDGVPHQDLEKLSWPDGKFDLVVTSDVLEHVPDPYRAHAEIARVLRPGGRHVFTVPFHQTRFHDEQRARRAPDGSAEILIQPALYHTDAPLFHGDPHAPSEGVLVYTVFGLEMLVRLDELGLTTSVYQIYAPGSGILGPNGLVFEAVRRPVE